MTYSEKLRDPRWQKKRLLIMKRDKFKCLLCGDKKTTLNVHHLKYTGNPWEAENENLQTLCQECHGIISFLDKNNYWQREFITSIFKTRSWTDDLLFYCLVGEDYFIMYYSSYHERYMEASGVEGAHLKGLINHFKLNGNGN